MQLKLSVHFQIDWYDSFSRTVILSNDFELSFYAISRNLYLPITSLKSAILMEYNFWNEHQHKVVLHISDMPKSHVKSLAKRRKLGIIKSIDTILELINQSPSVMTVTNQLQASIFSLTSPIGVNSSSSGTAEYLIGRW